jgi:flagellar biogenesis protein FliO
VNRFATICVLWVLTGAAPAALADEPPAPSKDALAEPSLPVATSPSLPSTAAADADTPRDALPARPEDDELHRPLGTSDMMTSFIKTMLMLGVVLGLAWLTLAKGMGKLVEKAQAGKRVKVIERIALDARRSLFLVEVDGVQFVLGGGDVVRLHDVGSEKRSFPSVLSTTSPIVPSTPRPGPATTAHTTSTPAESA